LSVAYQQNIFSFEDVRVALFSEHQQLLLCAGLSGAVQESQLRLSNATARVSQTADASPARSNFLSAGLLPESRTPQSFLIGGTDPSAVFSAAAHRESLKVIANGMDLAVRRMRRVSLEDIESQGLSVVDQFYSEAAQISDGVLAIALALQEAQVDSPSLFHAAYGVASTLLAAIAFANSGEGASLYTSSIMCHAKTRQALLQVVEMLHVGIHKLGGELPQGFSLQREGKRLQEFCSLVLTGFVIDATHEVDRGDGHRDDVQGEGEGGEHMSAEWRAEYHAAKVINMFFIHRQIVDSLYFILDELCHSPSGDQIRPRRLRVVGRAPALQRTHGGSRVGRRRAADPVRNRRTHQGIRGRYGRRAAGHCVFPMAGGEQEARCHPVAGRPVQASSRPVP
jgi:hypothetical protein